jgi:anti-sigma B factor antagonist
MSTALAIHERRVGPVTVLAISGWLVAYKGDEMLKGRVADLVRGGQTDLLLDLGAVDYIDSAGVGVLVSTLLHVTRRGGRLKLLHPSERVSRVLDITGLSEVFVIFAREDEALASFASAGGPSRATGG